MESARIGLVGAGAAAWALARGLAGVGAPVAAWARRGEAARELAARASQGAGAVEAVAELGALLGSCGTVVLAVSDRALAEVAGEVAAALPDGGGARGPVVLHTSGYHGLEPLAAVRARGRAGGVLHPLRPLVRGAEPRWSGSWFGVVGDAPAVERARSIASALGARALELGGGEEAKHAYHAGAALLSNGVVGLFDAALACFAQAGVDRDVARAALAELLAANLEHLRALDPGRALTGPAARGAERVVAGHLRALAGDADVQRLYRAVTEYLVVLASTRGTLEASGASDVRRALSNGA